MRDRDRETETETEFTAVTTITEREVGRRGEVSGGQRTICFS